MKCKPRFLRPAALVIFAAGYSANALPIFTATATCAGPAVVSPTQAFIPVVGCGGGSNASEASASAGPNGLGVYVRDTHFDHSTASGAGASASVQTDFMITGPAGNVTISLNLSLSAGLDDTLQPFGESNRIVRITAALGSSLYGGVVQYVAKATSLEKSTAGTIAIPVGLCAPSSPCNLITPQFTVPANSLLSFILNLEGTVGNAAIATGFVNAADTLYFPSSGPVFNLPAGYTAVINGMNVVDNQVVAAAAPGDVPEPATLLLTGCALVALSAVRRMRR